MHITRRNHAMQLPTVDRALSIRALLHGVIAPRYVHVSGIQARIVRDRDGHFQVGIPAADGDDAAAAPPSQLPPAAQVPPAARSEEHTSELQSLMRISYAVFCLTKKTIPTSPHFSLSIPSLSCLSFT